MSHERTLTARWILPVDGPPLRNGTIAISETTIVAVEPAGARRADVDLGNVAVTPGFVNAHTHLDLCDAADRFPPTADFTAWLRRVIAHRRQQTPEQIQGAVAVGIRESLRFGVTMLGDISAQGASWGPLAAAPLDAVVYREAIGLSSERGAESFRRVEEWLTSRPRLPHTLAGISPHAPYTVGKLLRHSLNRLRDGVRIPFATHLAETAAELALLTRHEGPFVRFLEDLGVYDADALSGIESWLDDAPNSTWIHANYLDPRLARSPIVYCPRTHDAFGHAPYPLREFLTNGVTVALGTDSLASNPDLSALAEARRVHEQFPDVAGDVLLRMLTVNGVRALYEPWLERTGTLAAGKDATLVVLPLPEREDADPHRLLWESTSIPARVMVRGRWLDSADRLS